MFLAKLGFLKNGLNNSGTNQYPMNTKLKPKFLVFLRKPVVLMLTTLYSIADEKAIKIDLTLTSPKLIRLSSLNLVIPLDHFTSASSNEAAAYLRVFLYEASINKKKYNTLSTEIFCVLTPINGCCFNFDFLRLDWFRRCSFYNYWNTLN